MWWLARALLLAKLTAAATAQGLRGAGPVDQQATDDRRLVANFQTGQVVSNGSSLEGTTEEQILQGEVQVEGTFNNAQAQIITAYLTDMTKVISGLPHVEVGLTVNLNANRLVYSFVLLPPPGQENAMVAELRLQWTHAYLFSELNQRKSGDSQLNGVSLYSCRLQFIEVVTQIVYTPLPTVTSVTTTRTSTSRTSTTGHSTTATTTSPHTTSATTFTQSTTTRSSMTVETTTTTTTLTTATTSLTSTTIATSTAATSTSTSVTIVSETDATATLKSTRTTTEAVWVPSTGTTAEEDNSLLIALICGSVVAAVLVVVGVLLTWFMCSTEEAVQRKLSNSKLLPRVIKTPVLSMHRSFSMRRGRTCSDELGRSESRVSNDSRFGDEWVKAHGAPETPNSRLQRQNEELRAASASKEASTQPPPGAHFDEPAQPRVPATALAPGSAPEADAAVRIQAMHRGKVARREAAGFRKAQEPSLPGMPDGGR